MRSLSYTQTATLLNNGKVLITGGRRDPTSRYLTGNLAELYDPSTGAFTATGNLVAGHFGPTATLLTDGTVLIAEGRGSYFYSDGVRVDYGGVELYDPATGTFSPTNDELTPLVMYRTATSFTNGEVLVTGGECDDCGTLSGAEVYDPSTGTFAATGSMTAARYQHSATLLSAGTVLIAGGICAGIAEYCLPGAAAASTEIYHPSTGTFSLTGNMTTARSWHTATLLLDGTVLMTGGYAAGAVVLASAELYTSCSVNNVAALPADLWQGAIARMKACAGTRFVRRLSTQPKEPVLEITEQQLDGRRFDRGLVLVKLSGAGTTATQVVGKREKLR
jgi:hypothetical protein